MTNLKLGDAPREVIVVATQLPGDDRVNMLVVDSFQKLSDAAVSIAETITGERPAAPQWVEMPWGWRSAAPLWGRVHIVAERHEVQ